MSKLFSSLVIGSAMVLTAGGADAFPSVPSTSPQTPSVVIQAAGGCGPGWHRGPGSACRPNRGPVVVAPIPGAVVVAPGPRCWWRNTPRGPVRVCR